MPPSEFATVTSKHMYILVLSRRTSEDSVKMSIVPMLSVALQKQSPRVIIAATRKLEQMCI